jgi:FkbM family methyltransferase
MVTGRLGAAPGPIIESFFGGKDCFFVQVGANDGVRGDPLHDAIKANPRWRGIFIEPLDEAFARLVTNHPNDGRYVFEQIAISNSTDEQWFYYVSDEDISDTGLPSSARGMGSLNRDHPLRHLMAAKSFARFTKEPEAYLSKKLVRCEQLMTVLDRHRVSHIDVFHVDAETYDYQIIQQIDFERFRPKIILYEHAMLGSDISAARTFLRKKGYRLLNCGALDTMAVRSPRMRGP